MGAAIDKTSKKQLLPGARALGAALVFLLVGGYGCCVSAAAPLTSGEHDEAIQVGELRRVYHLHVPPGYDGTAATPLVLVFHGLLENSPQMADLTGFNRVADQKGFFVVYPDSIGRHWNDGRGSTSLAPRNVDDVGFIAALIDHLKHTLALDPKRIYATGMSNGAMFSQRLACELSNQIAAIGPVSGTMAENIAGQCDPEQQVSVMEVHGTKDAFVLWNGGSVRALGGKLLSVSKTMAHWAQLGGCGSAPPTVIDEPHGKSQGGAWVRRSVYSPCRKGIDVVLYAIEGGRHTWPATIALYPALSDNRNSVSNTAEALWDFFQSHPKS